MVAEAGSPQSCSSSKLLWGQGSDCSVVVVHLRIGKVWVGMDPRSSTACPPRVQLTAAESKRQGVMVAVATWWPRRGVTFLPVCLCLSVCLLRCRGQRVAWGCLIRVRKEKGGTAVTAGAPFVTCGKFGIPDCRLECKKVKVSQLLHLTSQSRWPLCFFVFPPKKPVF